MEGARLKVAGSDLGHDVQPKPGTSSGKPRASPGKPPVREGKPKASSGKPRGLANKPGENTIFF